MNQTLRPAAALRWLRLHPDRKVAPMHFPTLMAECAPPGELVEVTDDLMRRKAVTRELGEAPLPSAVISFVDGEFALARQTLSASSRGLDPAAKKAAEEVFRHAIRSVGAEASKVIAAD